MPLKSMKHSTMTFAGHKAVLKRKAKQAVGNVARGIRSYLKSPKKKATPKAGGMDYNARKAHNTATQKRYSDYEAADKK